jgi:hypothetical protein
VGSLPTPEERYAALVAGFAADPRVDDAAADSGRRRHGFGAGALTAGGRIFAMLTPSTQFVVKLPRQRVEALVASGAGKHFDANKGRPMKEWLALEPGSERLWQPLAREALDFASRR